MISRPRILHLFLTLILTSLPVEAGVFLIRAEAVPHGDHRVRFELETSPESGFGSFMIRLDAQPGEEQLSGFLINPNNGKQVLGSGSSQTPFFLIDNGPQDLDPRKGIFAIEVDTSSWPDGWYDFALSVTNRPHPGSYQQSTKVVEFAKGNPPARETLPVSNVPAEHQVIYTNPQRYSAFPNLYHLSDGRLAVAFSARKAATHYPVASESIRVFSSDGGTTWKEGTVKGALLDRSWRITDSTFVRPNSVGWLTAPKAELEQKRKQGYRIKEQLVDPDKFAYMSRDVRIVYYDDSGKRTETKMISAPEGIAGLMGMTDRSAYLSTGDGLSMRAEYGRRYDPDGKNGMAEHNEVHFVRSDDYGQTWTCEPMFPQGIRNLDLGEFTGKIGFNETALEQTREGKIIALMRVEPDRSGFLWQTTSSDRGLTWETPIQTPIWGFPADLLTLHDGRLLAVYGYRRAPMGIRACLSKDHGRTWDIEHEIILRNDGYGNPSDLGYPQAVEMEDGTVVVVYYITNRDGVTHIACTRFNP